MARINTSIPSLIAQVNLARTHDDLAMRLERLATGLRINRGADDPAGLLVSERLRSELQGLGTAIANSERAGSVIATAEGYLAEVADLLESIKGLVIEAGGGGGVSREEIEANQLQIDSAVESITRIAETASFAGLRLLDGSLEYLTSGIPASAIAGVNVFSARSGAGGAIPVAVEVVASAQTAQLFLSGSTAGSAGALLSSVTVEVIGNLGVQTVTFVSGTPLSAVASAVNLLTDTTGVSASLVNAADQTSGLVFSSTRYGSDEFVSVRRIGEGGDFFSVHAAQGGPELERDEGRDVTAIINGALAAGRGLRAALNSPGLSLEVLLSVEFAQLTSSARTFDITGGGATFQLGPAINAAQQVGIGVPSAAAGRIGGTTISGIRHFLDSIRSGGANSIVSGGAARASEIVDNAISEISLLRGRLGAFERNTVQTGIRSLQVGLENITASESGIRDADFAAETAALTRARILAQAGTSVLATANLTSQSVLRLLA